MNEKTCDNCNLYKSSDNRALGLHRSHCMKNTAKIASGVSQWYCKLCEIHFPTKRTQKAHNKEIGHRPVDFIDREEMKIESICEFCKKHRSTNPTGFALHVKHCYSNPNRVEIKKREPMSDEQRSKLSEIMKERHRKNIAAKWKNPHIQTSYAEQFFSKVIENEFEDKDVRRELPMGGFFLDFAWPHKMKAIEIDGQQHDREYQKASDLRKDAKAVELGWNVLRIRFTDMYREPKKYIKIAKDFIHS